MGGPLLLSHKGGRILRGQAVAPPAAGRWRGSNMQKTTTIKSNGDFRRLYRARYAAGAVLVSYAARGRTDGLRIGITTGKKVGGAVQRNRCRRIIRAAYRQLEPYCAGRWDIVFVAREKTRGCKTQDIVREMRGQLKKLGVYHNEPAGPAV